MAFQMDEHLYSLNDFELAPGSVVFPDNYGHTELIFRQEFTCSSPSYFVIVGRDHQRFDYEIVTLNRRVIPSDDPVQFSCMFSGILDSLLRNSPFYPLLIITYYQNKSSRGLHETLDATRFVEWVCAPKIQMEWDRLVDFVCSSQ